MADGPVPDPSPDPIPDPIPDPQGKFLGMPYDWRKPTAARVKSRMWNPADPRLFTPRSYGWGYDMNFYWLTHPGRYFKKGTS
ncbi:MAG TPA: DUF5808 domain-containing protein [Actinomycetota bacterium]|nr:DUF5808 domain-containing protein [Actinomycetota bacterium]